MQAEPAVFFLPPYIITIIKSHGRGEGGCAEDLSCDEGDKGVQEFSAEYAVTTGASGAGRQVGY